MSLFGSIQLGGNTLQAMQIGLQVVGNNIANANTTGFIREEVLYSPAPVQEIGGLTLGLGVEIDAIVQKSDSFLNDRLRGAGADRASADVQRDALNSLETLIGELTDTDISTSLTSFFGAIVEISNGDGDTNSLRNLAIGSGETLTADIRRLSTRAFDLRSEYDTRISLSAADINLYAEEVRALNLRIVNIEAGGALGSDAGALRTERDNALAKLSELLDVQVTEQPSGAVNVAVGGESLIFEGVRREVQVSESQDGSGETTSTLRFADNNGSITTTGGEVEGLLEARDTIVGGFLDTLDNFAALLASEFNKLYSQGQGAVGFDSLTSTEAVVDASASLDEAGLPVALTSGSFQLLVYNPDEGSTKTTDITIDLDGLDGDTTLNSLAADLNAVDGVSASVNAAGRLVITADSSDVQFSFAGDEANESGVLAALGLNTFFTGSTARSIAVNTELTDGPAAAAKFAASLSGVGEGGDFANALRLSEFASRPLDAADGASLNSTYDQMINEIAQQATIAGSVADGLSSFEATLLGEQQALSGVNLDEEAIEMITLQRTYQASARFIQTVSDLLDVLVNL
ncbi:MAG: flagellar hook-associated protein FlgK [Planctomycetota bacterium]